MTGIDLSHGIRTHLEREGFPLHGATDQLTPPHLADYDTFLDKGFHGSMDYLLRHSPLKRSVKSLMEEARSIVMVALPYRTRRHVSFRDKPGGPHVSQYAWGRDYHRVIRKRLRRALEAASADSNISFNTRIFVDSAPVLERDFAALVGLGWIGKNGCLIHPQWGSFLFLGGAVLDVALDPWGQPIPDRCGRCRRCLEVCPTGALSEPRHLDGRRCIAAVTVESPVGDGRDVPRWEWLFGCDLCQEVCPFNTKSALTDDPDFAVRERRDAVDCGDLAAMDRACWADFSRGSPLGRISWEKISENILLASTPSGIRTRPPLAPSLLAALEGILADMRLPAGTRVEIDLRRNEVTCRPEDPDLSPEDRDRLMTWVSTVQLGRDYPIQIILG